MVTTATTCLLLVVFDAAGGGGWNRWYSGTTTHPPAGTGYRAAGSLAGRPQATEIRGEVVRQRRFDLDSLARERVRERKSVRVQELAPELLVRNAVDAVSHDREVDRGQMDADLVRPAGLEAHIQDCVGAEQLVDLEVRDRLARRVRVQRTARGVVPVAADRRVD